jgi:hypothetical protein
MVPNIDEALASLHRFEFVGLTDLFDMSMCLLAYQANRTLPPLCDCNARDAHRPDHIFDRWVYTTVATVSTAPTRSYLR